MTLGNKTIYAKNEELWDKAKILAGKAGLSGFVEEALQRLVTEKQLEQNGLERFRLPIEPLEGDIRFDRSIKERLGFDGKRLVDWGGFSVYLTKAGSVIVTENRCDAQGSIFDYRKYEELSRVRSDPAIERLETGDQSIVWNLICEALPPPEVTTWID